MSEILKSIKGFETYSVSNMGRVWSHKRKKWLKPRKNSGYLRVALCKHSVYSHRLIHRLVLTAFVSNPSNKPFANHKDLDKHNNVVENLEWVTSKENARHCHDNMVYFHKYNKDVVEKARDLRSQGLVFQSIADKLGVCKRTALLMCNGGLPVYS